MSSIEERSKRRERRRKGGKEREGCREGRRKGEDIGNQGGKLGIIELEISYFIFIEEWVLNIYIWYKRFTI